MVLATAIAPNHLSLALASTPPTLEANIIKAAEIWEQANNLLIDAGRLLCEVKTGNKRKFPKFLETAALEKSQVNKLIKAAQAADEIPSSVATRLGLPMLIQLGQPRNEAARVAIAHDDTQLSVAQKIKELRAPTQRKKVKPIRFIGGQKGGVGKLRIEVPGCAEAVELERDWLESGLPPLQWLQGRTVNAQNIFTEEEKSAVDESEKVTLSVEKAVIPYQDASDSVEAIVSSAKDLSELPQTTVVQELLEQGLIKAWVGAQIGLEVEAKIAEFVAANPLPQDEDQKPAYASKLNKHIKSLLQNNHTQADEQATAQSELSAYIEEQSDTIADAPSVDDEAVASAPSPIATEIPAREEVESDTLTLNSPILPTERYLQGWSVGEYAVPNTTYGYLPMSFRVWCLGQPVLIVEVAGSTGTVQTLTVARHDGETHHAMGDWLEETTVAPLTLPTTTEPQGATPSDCYTSATPTLRYKQGWKVGDMALANTVGGEYFVNWCEGKPIRIEQATGGVGEIQILRVSRHDGVSDMSYGNWIEDVPANPASDDNPPSETAEFASLYKVLGTSKKTAWCLSQMVRTRSLIIYPCLG